MQTKNESQGMFRIDWREKRADPLNLRKLEMKKRREATHYQREVDPPVGPTAEVRSVGPVQGRHTHTRNQTSVGLDAKCGSDRPGGEI